MAVITLDLDTLTARQIADRLAAKLRCGKARQLAALLDAAAREHECERRAHTREQSQLQRDQAVACRELRLLQLRLPFTAGDVEAAYRQAAKHCHPDAGGSTLMMQLLNDERSRLKAAFKYLW